MRSKITKPVILFYEFHSSTENYKLFKTQLENLKDNYGYEIIGTEEDDKIISLKHVNIAKENIKKNNGKNINLVTGVWSPSESELNYITYALALEMPVRGLDHEAKNIYSIDEFGIDKIREKRFAENIHDYHSLGHNIIVHVGRGHRAGIEEELKKNSIPYISVFIYDDVTINRQIAISLKKFKSNGFHKDETGLILYHNVTSVTEKEEFLKLFYSYLNASIFKLNSKKLFEQMSNYMALNDSFKDTFIEQIANKLSEITGFNCRAFKRNNTGKDIIIDGIFEIDNLFNEENEIDKNRVEEVLKAYNIPFITKRKEKGGYNIIVGNLNSEEIILKASRNKLYFPIDEKVFFETILSHSKLDNYVENKEFIDKPENITENYQIAKLLSADLGFKFKAMRRHNTPNDFIIDGIFEFENQSEKESLELVLDSKNIKFSTHANKIIIERINSDEVINLLSIYNLAVKTENIQKAVNSHSSLENYVKDKRFIDKPENITENYQVALKLSRRLGFTCKAMKRNNTPNDFIIDGVFEVENSKQESLETILKEKGFAFTSERERLIVERVNSNEIIQKL
ncbi:MAG: hypothetical protein J0H68_08155 [Sphingobacteriia bacterium]|nr:hypothetical protein [Sphingobacteriia bacterium]